MNTRAFTLPKYYFWQYILSLSKYRIDLHSNILSMLFLLSPIILSILNHFDSVVKWCSLNYIFKRCRKEPHMYMKGAFVSTERFQSPKPKRSIRIIDNIIVYSWLVSCYGSMLWSWGNITKRKEKKRNLYITVFGREMKYLNHSKILIFLPSLCTLHINGLRVYAYDL